MIGLPKNLRLQQITTEGVTIHHTGPHLATPDRTGPEMTDYFTSTTVTRRIKA